MHLEVSYILFQNEDNNFRIKLNTVLYFWVNINRIKNSQDLFGSNFKQDHYEAENVVNTSSAKFWKLILKAIKKATDL